MPTTSRNLAYRKHDHARCIDDALSAARKLCTERALRLTPLREQVLQLVWQSHKPLGAYAILDLLSAANGAQKLRLAPPTVYRALEFLLEHGLIHRVNSLNAFIGCSQPHAHHSSLFLICRNCETAVEINDSAIATAIHTAAQQARFTEQSACVEIAGLCPNCRRDAA
ncbi:MAG: Fur family transcriptional regulator [Verrucomicrobiaceae bacterium]|nr:Fur family transcriptional regulator [Verrucomicrobiaceae bacterium]